MGEELSCGGYREEHVLTVDLALEKSTCNRHVDMRDGEVHMRV